jgi:hypothetical protein
MPITVNLTVQAATGTAPDIGMAVEKAMMKVQQQIVMSMRAGVAMVNG